MNPRESSGSSGNAASDRIELSTLQAQLADVIERLLAVSDRYRNGEDSAVAGDIDAAERHFVSGTRALNRAMRQLDRMS